jgi:hypothetical protein
MKKIFVLIIFALTSLVMISCEGDLSGITLPTGDITLPTGEITTGDLTTDLPTTSDATTITSESTISEEPTTTEVPMTTEQPTTGSETETHTEVNTVEPTTTEAPTTEAPTTQAPTTEAPTTTEVSSEERQTEINNLRLVLQANDMDVSDEAAFAEELYDSGMTASDLTAMMQDISPLMEMSPEASMTDMYAVIDDVMADMDREMIRALLSAVIKVELKNNLEMQLSAMQPLSLEEDMTEEEVMMLEALIEFIETSGDDAVDTVMVVLNYVMDIQDILDPEIIENIETLSEKETFNAFDINLMVMIKNGLINAFKNALPSDQDFILVNSTIISLVDIMSGDVVDFEALMIQKQSMMQRMSISLMFDFVLSIDANYVTALINVSENPDDINDIKTFAHANIYLIDSFLEDYSTDIDALNNVLTMEEKVSVFNDFFINQMLFFVLSQDMDETMADDVIQIIHSYLDVENLVDLQMILGDVFEEIIDQIILNDYDLIDAFIDMVNINEMDYATYDLYNEAMMQQMFILIQEGSNVINPVVQDGTVEEFNVVNDLVMTLIGLQIELDGYMMDYDVTDQLALYNLVGDSIYAIETNVFSIMQHTVDFVSTSDYLVTLYPILIDMSSDPTQETMAQLGIEMANAYIDFYTLVSTDIDAIETEVIALLNDTSFQTLTDITQEEIDEVLFIFDEVLPNILNQAMLIKDYDYTNLTIEEMEDVQIFLGIFFPMPEEEPVS